MKCRIATKRLNEWRRELRRDYVTTRGDHRLCMLLVRHPFMFKIIAAKKTREEFRRYVRYCEIAAATYEAKP